MGQNFDRVFHIEEIFKFSCLFWLCFELEGLVILHCAVADGNSTRSPENDGLLCGGAGENCAGNAEHMMCFCFISFLFSLGKLLPKFNFLII